MIPTVQPVPTGPIDRFETHQVRQRCRFCLAPSDEQVLDLGLAPLDRSAADQPSPACERLRRLIVLRCQRCGLLQVGDEPPPGDRQAIAAAPSNRAFAGRPDRARRFCERAIDRWRITGRQHVVEVGSGDGSLLRFFRAWQLPVVGVEADPMLARRARLRGVPTWIATFGPDLAFRLKRAGIEAALLVMSPPTGSLPDIRKALTGAASVLVPRGILTFLIPDTLHLIGHARVGMIGHAQHLYPSVSGLQQVLAAHDLELVDVMESTAMRGHLRIWARRRDGKTAAVAHFRVRDRLEQEAAAGLDHPDEAYRFAQRALTLRRDALRVIERARSDGLTVVAYGASAETTVVANFLGLSTEQVACVVDRRPHRSGCTLPGTDVPVRDADSLTALGPDVIITLDSRSAACLSAALPPSIATSAQLVTLSDLRHAGNMRGTWFPGAS